VEDVLIAVCDGLKGLPEAITTACERTVMQQYIVFRIRNSFRYAGRQHRDGVVNIHSTRLHGPARASDVGPVRRVHGRMGQRYRAMVRLCESSWLNSCRSLSTTRRFEVLSTTTAPESINATIPRAVKAFGHFPNGTAALECLYLVTKIS
jgi:transposase-like protein